MKVEAVRASADALGEQGHRPGDKSVEEISHLTEEGTKYAKEGLPERNLLQSLGSGKPMSELKDPAHKIGLGLAAQEGLGRSIQAGEFSEPHGRSPEQGGDEEILQALPAWTEGQRRDMDEKGPCCS